MNCLKASSSNWYWNWRDSRFPVFNKSVRVEEKDVGTSGSIPSSHKTILLINRQEKLSALHNYSLLKWLTIRSDISLRRFLAQKAANLKRYTSTTQGMTVFLVVLRTLLLLQSSSYYDPLPHVIALLFLCINVSLTRHLLASTVPCEEV